ncbi:MAG: LolA family protein [Planctomycetota bacterium]|jgi:hypothetical protein
MVRTILAAALITLASSATHAQTSQEARDLLVELESAGSSFETLQGLLQYDRRFLLQGDRHIRRGALSYKRFEKDGVPRQAFEVRFDTLLLPMQGRMEPDEQIWAFNGEWLFEIRPQEKIYNARQLTLPDQLIDPLRLGEGPIPIPIGQKAGEVLARYDAQVVGAVDGLDGLEGHAELESFAAGSIQLHLTPLPSLLEEDDFREIRLWYDRETLLPRMSIAELQSGDISVVQLLNVRTNEALPQSAFEIDPPAPEDGWQVQIEPIEQAATDTTEGD